MSDSIIEDSIVRFFSKAFDRETAVQAEATGQLPPQWQQAVDSGLHNLLSPESLGGAGLAWTDAFALFWGLGYYRIPLPLAETVIANHVLHAAGQDVTSERPIALLDEVGAARLQLHDAGGRVVAQGSATGVHWARAAGTLLVGLPGGRVGSWALDGPGVRIIPRVDVTQLPADTIVFEGAVAERVFPAPFNQLELPLRHLGALARAAMIVGAAEFALQESVQYAMDRVQFGKAIGKNQAIQQQLAQMAGQVAIARHAATLAFRQVPSWTDAMQAGDALSAGCAKVLAGEAADAAAAVAHQVHGAIGFTYEHALNFATRRLFAWREDHGTASWWARRIGGQVAAAGGSRFWPALTHPALYRGLQVA